MRIANAEETRRHLGFPELMPVLKDMFRSECIVPLRHMHKIGEGQAEVGSVLIMPAWQVGRRFGIKTVSIFPGNTKLGKPGLHSVYTLFDAETGVPLALLDGNEITSRRTAAASALAAQRLSRSDSQRLLVLGSGRVASLLPDAFRAVRPISQIRVWNINADKAELMAKKLNENGFQAEAIEDLSAGAEWADIISCATLSTVPLIKGEWLRRGTHLDLIGSFTPAMRESDAECFRRATVFVDTSEALLKAGDILEAVKVGAFDERKVAANLTQLCRGEHGGRTGVEEITLFKAVGTALEDLASASLVYDSLLKSEALP
jgi:ornithine cyclodeaminase